MGLYYSPPQPFMGGPQPLEGPQLTPPSAPQAPPPRRSGVPTEVLACWAVAATVASTPQPRTFVPPQSAAPSFPLRAPSVPAAVSTAWSQSAPTPQPQRFAVPASGPAPQNPPVVGTSVPPAVLVAWRPPDPAPIVARLLSPPIPGPTPQTPPLRAARAPDWPAWWQTSPVTIPPVTRITPSGAPAAPYVVPSRLPDAVMGAWNSSPPPDMARRLAPLPAPAATVVPPGRIPDAILLAWAPIAWTIPAGLRLTASRPDNPPLIGAQAPPGLALWFAPPAPSALARFGVPAAAAGYLSPRPRLDAILSAWLPASWVVTTPVPLAAYPAPQNPPLRPARPPIELQSWIIAAPVIIARTLIVPTVVIPPPPPPLPGCGTVFTPRSPVNFSKLVLAPAMNAFARPLTLTPLRSMPGAPSFPYRGIWSVDHQEIALDDGGMLSTRTLTMGIRIAEFAKVPRQGDLVMLPSRDGRTVFNGVGGATATVTMVIDDVRPDGQGGAYLILKRVSS